MTNRLDSLPQRLRAAAAKPKRPRVVAFVSQKGGTGKTTLALHLAGAACAAGVPSAVLDLDPQGSASLWSDVCRGSGPSVAPVSARDLGAALAQASEGGVRLAILDTAPHSEGVALSAARAADLVVVPCGISLLDVHATAMTIELAALATASVGLLSMVPPRGQLKDDVRAELEDCGLPVLTSEIGHRMAYRYALQDGSLVQDFQPRSKAALEVLALWYELAGRLGVGPVAA